MRGGRFDMTAIERGLGIAPVDRNIAYAVAPGRIDHVANRSYHGEERASKGALWALIFDFVAKSGGGCLDFNGSFSQDQGRF